MLKRTNLKIPTCAMIIQTQNENKGNAKYRAERICKLSKVKVRISKLYLYSYVSDEIDLL